MINWADEYNPTWFFTLVDRGSWFDARPIGVTSCKLNFDRNAAIREDGSIETDENLGPEPIVRVYLEVEQQGETERLAVATLVMTETGLVSGSYDRETLKGYGPLIAMADDQAPLLSTALTGMNCMTEAARACEAAGIAPVVRANDGTTLSSSVVLKRGGSWLEYARNVAARANYDVASDGYGRTVFPRLPGPMLVPRYTFMDNGETVLVGDVKVTTDLRKIPNYCEVRVSDGQRTLVGTAVNDDATSPVSTTYRGRRVPLILENPSDLKIHYDFNTSDAVREADEYAEQALKSASTVAATVSIEHDFVPISVGDCVRVVSGDIDITGVLDTMSISCDASCACSSKVSYEESWWR